MSERTRRDVCLLNDFNLDDAKWGVTTELIRQEAIPWCTTHDSETAISLDGQVYFCRKAQTWTHLETHGCEVSTGGPDHKWWRDES